MCTTSTYTVSGMTCSHCALSVTEEITSIPGVSDVQVHLASGRVTVAAETALDQSLVRNAVEEAGYQLVAS